MTTDNTCKQCNAPLSPADTHGLCPPCLLRVGIGSDDSTIVMAGTRRLVAPPTFPFEFGGYRVLRLLGRGGMGAVYEAERRDTGRRVALKVLGHAIDSEEMRRRFLREGRLAASVNHPNTVYIFGSEEIDGEPVIAMELIAGGTLRDLIRKGPLPVRDAVDATLQIIAGLEAAATAGVLHRDVKPENCFVAPDGTVKVGDFGLSVSTLARNDTQLTASGVMLGTPAYAPPEQLSGDELDLRADIYSTGATLYALLAGRAPFRGDNAVQVVAAVLSKTPKPVAEFRGDAPAGLAQIVMRCLAKQRDERPANYVALRDALLPFSSHVPEPAPGGMRVIAGALDCLMATFISVVLLAFTGMTEDQRFLTERTLASAFEFIGVMLVGVAYFAIPEWLWGASPGKALCGLRVTPHGIGRAVLRALIVMLAMNVGVFIQLGISSADEVKAMLARDEMPFSEIAGPSFMFLLFVTMRRRNGFAAIHDLLTGTRVIARPKANMRPRLDVAPVAGIEPGDGERLGPFRVLGPMGNGWLAGYDDVLRRKVWIRTCTAGTPPLPAARRDLGRAGRLRWIAGARSEGGGWDAFDAPAGKPLGELIEQPWAAVRCWLLDLAEEIEAASGDGTLPAEISTAHVWITADGRALLLDEPWHEAASSQSFACTDVAATQHFLAAIAETSADRSRLPLHARDFTQKLAAAKFDRGSFLIGNLRSLAARPAVLSRGRQIASFALVPAAAIAIGMVITVFMLVKLHRKDARWAPYPELRMLPVAADYHANIGGNAVAKAAGVPDVFMQHLKIQAGKYIAGHFGAFIAGPDFDRHPALAFWSTEQRARLRETARTHSPVSAAELATADAALRRVLERHVADARMPAYIVTPAILVLVLAAMGVVQFISLLLFGITPGQRLFGFAVVDARGEPAGRGRILSRWLVIWFPFIVFAGLLTTTILGLHEWDTGRVSLLCATFGIWLVNIAYAAARPDRAIHSNISRTRVVPR